MRETGRASEANTSILADKTPEGDQPMPKTPNPLTSRSGPSMNVILTVVVVLVAVFVIGGVLLFSRSGEQAPTTENGQPAPELLQQPHDNVLTEASDDKVTLVEYLDYQCPACYQYYQAVTQDIEREYEGKIDFVVRNYPIQKAHPLARSAAQAAEAAGKQGKYADMYHLLYGNWQEWALSTNQEGKPTISDDQQRAEQIFTKYAQQIGLDVEKFRQDANSEEVKNKIDQDARVAERFGVKGTPTLFLNGERFQPRVENLLQVKDELRKQIDEELAK
jgi:protein-disulfide isomerase